MMVIFWQLPVIVSFGIILLQNGMAEVPSGCKSHSNDPVDWFIVYKLPNSAQFYYLDAYESFKWMQPNNNMESHGQAVYFTLQQIYGSNVTDGNFRYAMYSDQPPNSNSSPQNGHSKGVIAWAKTGFWLIHSTPRFPPIRKKGYSWPPSAKTNAQIFLCISLQESAYESKIERLLQKTYPFIYDGYGVQNIRPAHGDTLEEDIYSSAGEKFTLYAKPGSHEIDIYEYIAKKKDVDLMAQTWRREPKILNKVHKASKIQNVKKIKFPSDSPFPYTKDHSKWAVDTIGTMTCIGDLNRMESQKKRGGLVACFDNSMVSRRFLEIKL